MSIEPEDTGPERRGDVHGELQPPEWGGRGDAELIEAVTAHVEAHVGPIAWVSRWRASSTPS